MHTRVGTSQSRWWNIFGLKVDGSECSLWASKIKLCILDELERETGPLLQGLWDSP